MMNRRSAAWQLVIGVRGSSLVTVIDDDKSGSILMSDDLVVFMKLS